MVEIKLESMDIQLGKIRRGLLQLPKELDRKTLNSALMKGAVKIRNTARENAPVLNVESSSVTTRLPGILLKNIVAGVGKPASGMTATVIVGVRRLSRKAILAFKKGRAKGSSEANPEDPFYWRFMEFGFTDRSGKWHAGTRFLRNAFERQKVAVIPVIAAEMKVQLKKAAAKLGFDIV